jgi:hypothetical protein
MIFFPYINIAKMKLTITRQLDALLITDDIYNNAFVEAIKYYSIMIMIPESSNCIGSYSAMV